MSDVVTRHSMTAPLLLIRNALPSYTSYVPLPHIVNFSIFGIFPELKKELTVAGSMLSGTVISLSVSLSKLSHLTVEVYVLLL